MDETAEDGIPDSGELGFRETTGVPLLSDELQRMPTEAGLIVLAELERRVEERTSELREREARYTTLFESIDEGVCIIQMIFDDAGKPIDYQFLEVNSSFERQTGLKDAAGKRMKELAPLHEEHWFETYGHIAVHGEPIRFQNHAEQLNRWYDVYACRIGRPDERQVAIFFNDITEKREMDIALREARDRAESANQAKSEFLSRMSHELRTPLNAVLGFAQLLDLQYSDPTVKEASHSILSAGKHLLGMINEILDLSRIESGSFAISLEPVPVSEILSHAIALVRPLAENHAIQITIEGDLCEHLHVQADRQRLLQVFINLLGNAVKYNKPAGLVTIQCFDPVDGTGRIQISDTGNGISLENQKLLFRPFQKFSDPGIEGTGLGLALSEGLVRLMGGRLGLKESSSAGSTFFLDLRTAVPVYKDPEITNADVRASLAKKNLKGTVLYIEDNPSNMRLLEMVLAEFSDVTLIPINLGLVGLEMARERQPDLILLDVHLPDLMGDKVLLRLKADPATRSIPVVILSADATHRQLKALKSLGAEEYLTKPIDLVRLFEVLGQYLSG